MLLDKLIRLHMTDGKPRIFRNGTAEFLIFTGHSGEQNIEARYVRIWKQAGR
jgi:hypothetical protein